MRCYLSISVSMYWVIEFLNILKGKWLLLFNKVYVWTLNMFILNLLLDNLAQRNQCVFSANDAYSCVSSTIRFIIFLFCRWLWRPHFSVNCKSIVRSLCNICYWCAFNDFSKMSSWQTVETVFNVCLFTDLLFFCNICYWCTFNDFSKMFSWQTVETVLRYCCLCFTGTGVVYQKMPYESSAWCLSKC